MSSVRIKSTKHTPSVVLDPESNEYEISGNSRPEDAEIFYSEITTWIDENTGYISNLKSFNFKIDLEYYNSSSAKELLSILYKIETIVPNTAIIHWYFDADDEELEEAGKEFEELLTIPFHFHQK